MNFYYVRPFDVVPSEEHKVVVIPFRTPREDLIEIQPMFGWIKTSYAWKTISQSKPDSMNDVAILEAQYGWKKICS